MSTSADIAKFQMSAPFLVWGGRSFKLGRSLNFSAVKRGVHLGWGALSDNCVNLEFWIELLGSLNRVLLSLTRKTSNLPLIRNFKASKLFLTELTFKSQRIGFQRENVTLFKASFLLEVLSELFGLLIWVIAPNLNYLTNTFKNLTVKIGVCKWLIYRPDCLYFCSKFVKDDWQISPSHLTH